MTHLLPLAATAVCVASATARHLYEHPGGEADARTADAAYRPLPGDDYLDPGIVVFDVDWIDGYESFVADHGTRFLDDACVPTHSTARLTRTGVFYGPQLATMAY